MKNKLHEIADNSVAEVILRHFPSANKLVVVGDSHSNSKTVKFEYFDGDSMRTLIARYSPTAMREVQAFERIRNLGGGLMGENLVPCHRLIENDLMVRDYVPGLTLNQINTSFVGAMEAVGFLRDKAGLPTSVVDKIVNIVFGPKLSRFDFFECIVSAFRSWPSHLGWENEVAKHQSIPLPGEALRKPIDLLYHWHISPIPMRPPERRPKWLDVRKAIGEYLQRLYRTVDFHRIEKIIYSQVDRLREVAGMVSLYDIHYDNLVLAMDGRICLIDLECAGMGYADFANMDLQFVDDLASNGISNELPIWAHGWNPRSRALRPIRKIEIKYSGPARIILCGTSAFERIAKTALETIFYILSFKWGLVPPLDGNDHDIAGFPEPWRSFQKLKRIARGCGSVGDNVVGEELKFLVKAIIHREAIPDNYHRKCEIENFMINIRMQNYEPGSAAHLASLRVAELIRFLPFELLLGRKVRRQDFDIAINDLGVFDVKSELSSLVNATLSDLMVGQIPYHLWNGTGNYSLDRKLMRRARRKIVIAERVQSKRSEYWLNDIVTRSGGFCSAVSN